MPDFIDEIIEAEGGATETNDPSDSGGRTKYGISEKANPLAWADGTVTYPEAREIYSKKYILDERFDQLPNKPLQHQVIDFGVTAGPDTAARMLQSVVGTSVDGEIGKSTLKAIIDYPPQKLYGFYVPGIVAVNVAFERARAEYYINLAVRRVKDTRFLRGWINRTFSFRSKE